jgi:hypothetical protein
MATSIAQPTKPLASIIPSYLYQQYADDPNLQAFVGAYNALAQSYLDWFNATPFAVYTSQAVSGPLLDWIGQGIYGIPRPVFSSLSTRYLTDAINVLPMNQIATDGSEHQQSGAAVVADDDFYKRTITWAAYLGDGRVCSVATLRRRIARFLYGVAGGDITIDEAQNVNIAVQTSPSVAYVITLPSSANPASTYFQEGFNSGALPFPFELSASVNIV